MAFELDVAHRLMAPGIIIIESKSLLCGGERLVEPVRIPVSPIVTRQRDRPKGVRMSVGRVEPDCFLMAGLQSEWPLLLGVNEVRSRADVKVPARTAAWPSDIGPHWLAPAFCEWDGYARP